MIPITELSQSTITYEYVKVGYNYLDMIPSNKACPVSYVHLLVFHRNAPLCLFIKPQAPASTDQARRMYEAFQRPQEGMLIFDLNENDSPLMFYVGDYEFDPTKPGVYGGRNEPIAYAKLITEISDGNKRN